MHLDVLKELLGSFFYFSKLYLEYAEWEVVVSRVSKTVSTLMNP